jgi:radical SAM protein with 4Fe4S-binding SPASM domain
MDQNLNELENLIKLSSQKKTNGINFQCLLPNLGIIHPQKQENLWPKNITKLKRILLKVKNQISTNPNILAKPSFIDMVIKYYSNPVKSIKQLQCAAVINNFIIDHKGDVRLCFNLPPIGNIYNSQAKEIWLSHTSKKQRPIIRKCQQNCKIIACNQIDYERGKAVKNYINNT